MNNQELMNELMEKYNGDWIDICTRETLSEDFIREFKNIIYWIIGGIISMLILILI